MPIDFRPSKPFGRAIKVKMTEVHGILSLRQLSLRTLVALLSLSAVLALLCEPSWCADAGPIVISVPEGFEGPTRNDTEGGLTVAWIKRQPASAGGTLLQISAIDVGTSLDGITAAQRVEATAH